MLTQRTLKSLFSLVALSSVMLGLASCGSSTTSSCENKVRAVVDMGSGSTKMTVAEVQTCGDQKTASLVRILDDKSGEALALEAGKNPKGEIPLPLQEQAAELLGRMQTKALETAAAASAKKIEIAFVGTHAFRTATNMAAFRSYLAGRGFEVLPWSQDDEAMTGVKAVQILPVAKACPNFLVWDVGGGSAQFSFERDGKLESLGIQVGAEAFKSEIIKAQKNKKLVKARVKNCEPSAASPNPIGQKNVVKALAVSRALADKQIKILPLQTSCAIGIGGVHRKAIEEQIEKLWPELQSCTCAGQTKEESCSHKSGVYTKKELSCLTQYLSAKSDCDEPIKGPYSATAVSNLYMVKAFMDKFGFEQIHTASVNMGHALVLDANRLSFKSLKTKP